ncbi:hypothetical protein ACFL45_10590 [Candidatus Neomarinimicrobiota bacterium]
MRRSITLIAIAALMSACNTSTSSDPEPLRFHEVVYGGCAGMLDMSESTLARWDSGSPYTHLDTLVVTWDDSLKIFLGLNYICCAPFAAGHEIVQDTLVLAVRDTCPVPATTCYCRCMCYYTFTWMFEGGEEEIGNLQVELYDPRVGTVAVLYRKQLEYH